ncbi:STAS/SEC14 domain-containing protein [Marinobacter sp.]|uniref:STAS/SEC14 domain-containing protein n=1 Tax=Marinobacter sp. TaxID=50741 RepID=UPI003A928FEA
MLKHVSAPDHVIALSLEGKLTSEDIQQYRITFERKLKEHVNVGVYVDLTRLSDMSRNALIEGAKADMELFSHAHQLGRCALVSDKEWPQTMASVAQQLFPALDMKVFSPDQTKEALSWAADTTGASAGKDASIRFIHTSKDNVLAFEIDGVMSSEEMPGVIKKLEDFFAGQHKVRLLNRMKHFGGFDPSILMQSGLFSMKLSAMEKVERYAVVGAPGWMRKIIDTMNPFFPDIDMQTFPADREHEAWAWLEAEPVK